MFKVGDRVKLNKSGEYGGHKRGDKGTVTAVHWTNDGLTMYGVTLDGHNNPGHGYLEDVDGWSYDSEEIEAV